LKLTTPIVFFDVGWAAVRDASGCGGVAAEVTVGESSDMTVTGSAFVGPNDPTVR